MKKFYNKISKPQWRVSIASVTNPSFFRRSPCSNKEDGGAMSEKSYLEVPNKKKNRNSSGSYDLQQAQLEFDQNNAIIDSVVVEPNLSESDSEENYEDARGNSDKMSSADELESSFYADAISSTPNKLETSSSLPPANEEFHYDVPKISFSFFDGTEKSTEKETAVEEPPEYEIVTVRTAVCKPALDDTETIPLYCNTEQENEIPREKESGQQSGENGIQENPIEKEQLYAQVKFRNKHRSEMKIVLKEGENKSQPDNEESVIETTFVDMYLTKSLEEFDCVSPMKSGSDPNISHSLNDIPEEDEENIYKVPINNKRYRLSQSLTDFNLEDVINAEIKTSNSEDIEHISCSQILLDGSQDGSAQNLEYCKARSKLPLRLRRATFLRKPRNKAAGTWSHFRTKVSNLMAEHAAKQKMETLTPNGETDSHGINLEEMYKNSKDKCKKVLKNTGKIFNSKVRKDNSSREHGDGAASSETSSQIIKNDAFFAKVRLKSTDIEYKFNNNGDSNNYCDNTNGVVINDWTSTVGKSAIEDAEKEERNGGLDMSTLKAPFKRSKSVPENQSGFEDLRKYVKQGSDFCKELSTILQERSDAELQYSKALAKLSAKLSRACRDNVGAINEAWRAVAYELEARAEAHRVLGGALAEDAARPLRNLTETQHKSRKQAEGVVDKAARALSDWRGAEAKGKKHSHACARDNEKLQDQLLDVRLSRTSSLIQLTHMHNQKSASEKETAKLEGKKRKAEDAVKKADIEYYTLCVRAERARLEWESAVLKGSNTFQTLEDERLNNLKTILTAYLHHSSELGPRLIEATERLKSPVSQSDPTKDLVLFVNLRNSSQQLSEQLLPDFYCEHITLAMNRERRKQALIKLLHLIRQDIERERKSKNGLENLSKAMKQTPNFGAEDSQQNVSEKLYHMKSMLTYLEGARYKVQSALFELDNRPKAGHPLAPHITITRDKSGLQHSVLKVPQWLREEWTETERSPVSEKSEKSEYYSDGELLEPEPDWTDRGAADDEFSSQTSSTDGNCDEGAPLNPIATCRALYAYTPNLPDELTLHPGDILSVYRKQDDGWWLGECDGNVGIFPATYVENVVATT
ncbi:uncharacterized protein LOC108736906 isoform X2 [Agrilus planipennis]|uniref:Uncharacterized protein LOC108736906 isoform X2 n=1 Tax=Agrilus planipennis TaxID=224129 RepID=A0A1W4WM83_AGRPL|nr:uncharacterized protein LOC108736906 isoform X2 [Agrilus planipennis]